jgi:hypothetical protein
MPLTWCWVNEYNKQSTKIFNFLVQDTATTKCDENHKFDEGEAYVDSDECSDEESVGNADKCAGLALCDTANYDLSLMDYHLRNCMGVQSDRL